VGIRSNNFIERSIMGALSFLKESVFADQYAGQKGFLQSIDPRIKAISIFLFIILALLAKSFIILLFLYAICLCLAYCSRISLRFFLKRTWVFIPLFSLFIAVPALFSIFSPGEPVITFKMPGFILVVTRQGMAGAGLFVTRVITCVSFAVLLSITTGHFQLLKVLRIFRIPQIFVMTLGMCYRYVYLFVEVIEDIYRAIKSRVGTQVYYKKGQNIVAGNIAFLWARSHQLNEDVYKAMLSRGYRGEPRLLDDFKMRSKDWAWLVSSGMFFILTLYVIYAVKF
jgi:cobalt/nickel transport system permease protein